MYLTRNQVRELDRRAIEEFGVPGVVLMENAGRSAAEILLSILLPLPASGRGAGGEGIVICCGKGNNAGDGFVIARHLDNHGVPVRVLLFAQSADLTGDAAINFRIIERAGLPIRIQPAMTELSAIFAKAAWLVDALFGTGLTGAVRPPFDQIIHLMNASGKPILAVDIPSGLDCDSGVPLGPTVRATHTVTFVAEKTGFANSAARDYLGQVHVADIGVPRVLLS